MIIIRKGIFLLVKFTNGEVVIQFKYFAVSEVALTAKSSQFNTSVFLAVAVEVNNG